MNCYLKVWLTFLSVLFFGVCETKGQFSSSEHIITLDSSMVSFTIKFQNLQADTIHSILIVDSLSSNLDLASFELGVSSHHYDFFFLEENVVCWHIYNVRIPGIADEAHSHGFVKYHINYLKGTGVNAILNKPSIYYNYEVDHIIDVTDIISVEHHEFTGVEMKENVKVEVVEMEEDVLVKGSEKFEDEQLYLEVFDDYGTVEFFAKMNKRDGLRLNASFLKSGTHYLDVYDNHHHEAVKRFTKK